MEGIKYFAKSFNNLRIKTFRHVNRLCIAQRVTPDDLRVIVCNPERIWDGDDHKLVCLAKSIAAIFTIVSNRKYISWQNHDLLDEIIGEYGDSKLKGELDSYCKELEQFENEILLSDVKNIVFTPLGNRYLMKAPIPKEITNPTMGTVRAIQNGLRRNGFSNPLHHAGINSPLAIFFIVPRLFVPPTEFAKLSTAVESANIEDRVICTLSEEDVLHLMGVSISN